MGFLGGERVERTAEEDRVYAFARCLRLLRARKQSLRGGLRGQALFGCLFIV